MSFGLVVLGRHSRITMLVERRSGCRTIGECNVRRLVCMLMQRHKKAGEDEQQRDQSSCYRTDRSFESGSDRGDRSHLSAKVR